MKNSLELEILKRLERKGQKINPLPFLSVETLQLMCSWGKKNNKANFTFSEAPKELQDRIDSELDSSIEWQKLKKENGYE